MAKRADYSAKGRLIILALGRDVVAAAERMLGQKADAIIKRAELTPEEYPEVRNEFYQYLKKWQEEPLKVILSGPVAFNFTLGQMVGVNHFDLEVFQFNAEKRCYDSIFSPSRSELI
jgi:hypothetical protein